MKSILVLCFVFLLALVPCGCGNKKTIDKDYPWPSTEHRFDSLSLVLERRHMSRDHRWDSVLRVMEGIAGSARRPEMDRRLLFYKAIYSVVQSSRGNGSAPLEYLRKAMSLTDSASSPYEFMRMRDIEASIDGSISPIDRYRRFSAMYDYAEKHGIDIWGANLLMQMANIEQQCDLYETALEHQKKAVELFLKAGNSRFATLVELNIANALVNMERQEEADSIYSRLLGLEIVRSDPGFLLLVLLNKYGIDGDSLTLKKARGLAECHPFPDYRGFVYANMARQCMEKEDPAGASFWISRADSMSASISDMEQRASIIDLKMNIDSRFGQVKDLLDSHNRYVALSDSAQKEKSVAKMSSMVVSRQIGEFQAMEQAKGERIRQLTVLLSVSAVIAMVALILFFRSRMLGSRLRMKEAELSLEKSLKKNLTLELMLEENRNLVRAIEKKIDTLPDGNTGLRSMLRVSKSGEDDWDSFNSFFEKVHPKFQRLLREKYGIRSESRIKLACYIWMGLSSKQIAKLLMIEPESVMKSRYRLRSQMGLSPDESLEETLLRLGDEG